ncbi:hypothetical protein LCGC14_2208920 [marine sediment metagenome]|uniref:Uncharacterized protein n=1 Tax=marine sediment metagenome TaxID=412755 RepID=A0A0F9E1W6_9ZZZZ
MGYTDEVKTCENLAKEFFDELEGLVYSGLMKDNTDQAIWNIRNLIKKYKPKMVS